MWQYLTLLLLYLMRALVKVQHVYRFAEHHETMGAAQSRHNTGYWLLLLIVKRWMHFIGLLIGGPILYYAKHWTHFYISSYRPEIPKCL